MPKVRLFFGLRDVKGRTELEVDADTVEELFEKLAELVPNAFSPNGPRPGYLVFIDRVDYRILGGEHKLRRDSTVDVVPVNHPG